MDQILQKHFKFNKFLPLQEEIISSVLSRKDTLAILPTGGGKSLCYQLPAMVFDGLTIVVSPLIALMKDQVGDLQSNNIPAAYLNSSLGIKEERQIKQDVLSKKIKILYVAPERLLKPEFIDFISSLSVSLIAVDEAHCISEWGHDFRPEYRNLHKIREIFKNVPVVALTASATPKVRRDIIAQLKFNDHNSFCGGFDRKNLFYSIRPKENAYYHILSYLEDHKGQSGIIYCHSRATADKLAAQLVADGIEALPYHAGLTPKERSANQETFMKNEAQIMVATVAFGMGIDKPDIRFVIHYDLPKNIESYYQETGRAGRDGKPADCILFFSLRDKIKHEFLMNKWENSALRNIAKDKLEAMSAFCTSYRCRRKMLLGYFGEDYGEEACSGCDICGFE